MINFYDYMKDGKKDESLRGTINGQVQAVQIFQKEKFSEVHRLVNETTSSEVKNDGS
jgi:hypothetical protein